MAVQFSLSYDTNGDPVLVENTVTGTRKVVSSSSVVSPYKSRFETPAKEGFDDPDTPDTPEEGNDIYRYINEMENNADNDMNLSFVDKQNLGRYTPEAMEAKGKDKSRAQQVMEVIGLAMIPHGNALAAVVKGLGKILPQESEEIKAIKQFYADPQQAALVESIPGMSNYNLVYGNPFNPSYGLADAADRRTATMAKTLARKYGMTAAEIEMAKVGTYTGDVDSDLIKRIKKTTDLSRSERGEITRIKEQRAKDLDDMRGGVGRPTDGRKTQQVTFDNSGMNSPVNKSTFQESNEREDRNTGNNNSGYSGGYDSSTGNYSDPYSDDTE